VLLQESQMHKPHCDKHLKIAKYWTWLGLATLAFGGLLFVVFYGHLLLGLLAIFLMVLGLLVFSTSYQKIKIQRIRDITQNYLRDISTPK